jgi:hypothetical protein
MTTGYKFESGKVWSATGPEAARIGDGGISFATMPKPSPKYKYKEDQIIADFHAYIDKTYGQHYMTEEQNIECFDVWLALGDSLPTFRNTAIKYLWRYGKKKGSNKDDLMKVLHYTLMMLYNDHYKDNK